MAITIGGGVDGSLFRIIPPHVDPKARPGATKIPPNTLWNWLRDGLTLKVVVLTPNLIWLAMTLAFYFVFPLDLESPQASARMGPLTLRYMSERLPLWAAAVLGYNAFFSLTLEGLHWCERVFIPGRHLTGRKMFHNIFYTCTGIVIWTGFENAFAFLWSTGRLAYIPDDQLLSSPWNAAVFALGFLGIILWRDIHFYFFHRFAHFRPLFRYIHSLHHRNTDIEVFSGLCMHPVEHLYYYACVLPNLLMVLSPVHLVFNGCHLLWAPGVSHSGWEDVFQSDALHYYHHRYFEVNYAGGPTTFLDAWFGSYWGDGWREKTDQVKLRPDEKASLNLVAAPPQLDSSLYMLVCVASWIYFGITAHQQRGAQDALMVAVGIGFGPVLLAMLLHIVQDASVVSMIKPFDKRPAWETVLHLVAGCLCTGVPIALGCHMCLAP